MIHRLKNIIIIILFLMPINAAIAQQYGMEIGVSLGASYYMGDINLSKHFYSPHPNFGGLIKLHFNQRNILKIGVFTTNLSAADKDFSNRFQQIRDASFSTSFTEINICYEVNFLQYILGQTRKCSYSPYLQVGLATYFANKSEQKIGLGIPIGLGFKKNISKHFIIGIEWSFHKLFSDKLDNLTGENIQEAYSENYGVPKEAKNSTKQIGFRFNQDWQMCALITFSYSFKIGGLTCNAYW